MWSRADFDMLTRMVPFAVSVDWDVRPSALKYGHVNSLLAMIRALHDQGGAFVDSKGRSISTLRVAPLKRKLTDRQKRQFSIVGHNTARPILIAIMGKLQVDVYFNQHFFVETATTYRQYFPSASVILQPRNFLMSHLVPSPGSWGSDMISLTCDWSGTFILEAAVSDLTGRVRRNFRGYKLIPAKDKYFLARRRPPVSEQRLLKNNGFTKVILGDDVGMCWPSLSRAVACYIRNQSARLNKKGSA